MGQPIVYCSNCSAQVRGADFEARRAFKVDEEVFCAKCCREILGAEPAPTLSPSSTKIKASPSPSSSKSSSSTSRISISSLPSATPARPKSGSVGAIAAVLGIGIVVVIIAIATSGGNDRRESHTPSPALPSSPALPAPLPSVSPKEAAAKEALAKALRFAADHPQDLAGQRALFAEAVSRAAGTPLLDDARRELDRADRKVQELRTSEFGKLDQKAREASARGKTEEALALWRTARGRFDDPSWAESIDQKIRDLENAAPAPTPAPSPADPKPTPPPAAAVRAPEDAARRARWETAVSPATGRDYAAALAAVGKLGDASPEGSLDLQLLRSVSSLHQQALQALTRTPKGQTVEIEFRDGTGEVRRAKASFVGEEDARVELRSESATVEIEAGEILPSSLAEILRSRGGVVDLAAAAIFCLLEGEEESARRLLGDKASTIPERYWSYGRKVAAARLAPDSARGLYQEALALANAFATAADAVLKYQALLRDHAESSFVRRNKASLAARLQQCARDYLFLPSDLKASGSFKAARSPKGGACWTSDADADPAKLKENFLELSYSVLADTPYKCWIYAGACCQETFEFWVQGTEMTGPAAKGGKEKEGVEPGSGLASVVKPWLSTLKKTHSAHLGPKQPSHWEWLAIPLPKYAKPGLQRLRVLTDQKGFSVAYACVTATRSGPPREIDLKELEKSRGERPTPIVVQGPKAIVLFACAFDGTDRRLVGDFHDKALYGQTLYESCFTGVEGNPVFTMPAQGELRITYYLKSPTPLTARFRIRRGDKSVPYDASVPQPGVGRPTEIRIPFSEFKPAYGPPGPSPAAGDVVPMVYFFGQDLNCGLRVDALSIVELRQETSGKTVAENPGKLIFSETFENGSGKFQGGEIVDGGAKGSKALSLSPKGTASWGAWSVPVKDSVTISFKLKALADLSRIEVMVWSESLKDNGRYFIDGLKKGEWREIRFKAVELRIGYARDGPSVDLLNNIKIFFQDSNAEVRILLDDFEIRE